MYIFIYVGTCAHMYVYVYICSNVTCSYKKLKYPFSKYFKDDWKRIVNEVTLEKFSVKPE